MLPITDTPQSANAARPGRTLVASHSFSFARREWIEASALLSEQFRVVAVDAPGHGEKHRSSPAWHRSCRHSTTRRCANVDALVGMARCRSRQVARSCSSVISSMSSATVSGERFSSRVITRSRCFPLDGSSRTRRFRHDVMA